VGKQPSGTEDELVARAFDADKHEELARAIEQLNPEEAAFFLAKLEAAIRKRKIQITGYLVAMGVWVIGMMFALVWYGTHDGFVGWVFLVPFAFVGLVLYGFGTWATRVGETLKPTVLPSDAPSADPQLGESKTTAS
jgi:hypothetical protein